MKTTKEFIAEKSIELNTPISKVWSVITTNETVEIFMLGVKPRTDWKTGSVINWVGRHEGEEHNKAKGKITQLIPEKLLEYTFFYGGYGHEDVPEHYQTVRFELSKTNGRTTQLKIKQGDYAVFEDGETYLRHATHFWEQAGQMLKEICERK